MLMVGKKQKNYITVLGKLLGKCSELRYQLLYIKLSFTTPKPPPPQRCIKLSYSNISLRFSSLYCILLQESCCRHQPKDWFVMSPSYGSASVGSTYMAVYGGVVTDWSFCFRLQQNAPLDELQRCLEKCSLCGRYRTTWSIKELSYWKAIWFRKQRRYHHATEK